MNWQEFICYYRNTLSSSFFDFYMTYGALLFAAKTFIVLQMKVVYDSDEYKTK